MPPSEPRLFVFASGKTIEFTGSMDDDHFVSADPGGQFIVVTEKTPELIALLKEKGVKWREYG